jgi:hypothetical protein
MTTRATPAAIHGIDGSNQDGNSVCRYPNGVALSVPRASLCDVHHYQHHVSPGQRLAKGCRCRKSKVIADTPTAPVLAAAGPRTSRRGTRASADRLHGVCEERQSLVHLGVGNGQGRQQLDHLVIRACGFD